MRDDQRIVLMRGLRQFAYGLPAVWLGISRPDAAFTPAAIGALIPVSLAGDFGGTYLIALHADRWGGRRTLIVMAALMAATGAVFGLTHLYPLLLVAGFVGTLGSSASETAPFLPVEQAMLPLTCPPAQRTALFARYNLVASLAGALGALAAGLPALLVRFGLAETLATQLLFGVYAAAALVVALLVARPSPGVEAPPAERAHAGTARPSWQRVLPSLGKSRRVVLPLAALFSVDALAGGLIVQSLMALFFHLRFGVSLAALGVLFFGANLLAALSFLAAPLLARRFGLLNTMVFTHLPSNILLLLVPVMPSFPLAALTLLLRHTRSQMDVPTRQAYTMALVPDEERTAAASVTSLPRSAGSASTPCRAPPLLPRPLLPPPPPLPAP